MRYRYDGPPKSRLPFQNEKKEIEATNVEISLSPFLHLPKTKTEELKKEFYITSREDLALSISGSRVNKNIRIGSKKADNSLVSKNFDQAKQSNFSQDEIAKLNIQKTTKEEVGTLQKSYFLNRIIPRTTKNLFIRSKPSSQLTDATYESGQEGQNSFSCVSVKLHRHPSSRLKRPSATRLSKNTNLRSFE